MPLELLCMIENVEHLLEKLFESVPKVRLLRLFARNQDQLFTFENIVRRSQIRRAQARRELKKLLALGLIKQRVVGLKEEVTRKYGKKSTKTFIKTKRTKVYFANPEFRLLPELQDLLTKDAFASRKKLLLRAKGLGKIKLLILSGIFVNSNTSRTDILIVGDHVRQAKLEKFLAELESDIGRPLHYTLMNSEEFAYRLDMYDRFLRDILEFPHEKMINKLKI